MRKEQSLQVAKGIAPPSLGGGVPGPPGHRTEPAARLMGLSVDMNRGPESPAGGGGKLVSATSNPQKCPWES